MLCPNLTKKIFNELDEMKKEHVVLKVEMKNRMIEMRTNIDEKSDNNHGNYNNKDTIFYYFPFDLYIHFELKPVCRVSSNRIRL